MLKVTGVSKTYGQGPQAVPAVGDLTFEMKEHELLCIVGPSGCGKTTLLKMMSGLMAPSSGTIKLDGQPITGPPEQMAVVFQDYSRSLYPWMKVGQNISFPLEGKQLSRADRRGRVERAVHAVGLDGFSGKYPWQLSGGMQQRVAIARAVAYRPQILLMDEPFASVDAQTRADLEDLLLRVRAEFDVTVVFVTHDIDESVYLSDRVLILSPRPSFVQETLEVPLPKPRDQIATKELPAFAHLRAHVFTAIKRRSHADGAAPSAPTHDRDMTSAAMSGIQH